MILRYINFRYLSIYLSIYLLTYLFMTVFCEYGTHVPQTDDDQRCSSDVGSSD